MVSSDNSYCDSPPPVVVMRRTLPNVNGKNVTTSNDNNNNMKRLKTGDEFVRVSYSSFVTLLLYSYLEISGH